MSNKSFKIIIQPIIVRAFNLSYLFLITEILFEPNYTFCTSNILLNPKKKEKKMLTFFDFSSFPLSNTRTTRISQNRTPNFLKNIN